MLNSRTSTKVSQRRTLVPTPSAASHCVCRHHEGVDVKWVRWQHMSCIAVGVALWKAINLSWRTFYVSFCPERERVHCIGSCLLWSNKIMSIYSFHQERWYCYLLYWRSPFLPKRHTVSIVYEGTIHSEGEKVYKLPLSLNVSASSTAAESSSQ